MLLLICVIIQLDMHANHSEPWKVTLVDTGEETLTAGRLKKYTLI